MPNTRRVLTHNRQAKLAYNKNMGTLFISYSNKNRPFVAGLVRELKKAGHEVWWDIQIPPGEEFPKIIEDAIKRCDYCIVVLSPQSVKSGWVRNEYMYAKGRKKKIIPIMIRKCELPVNMASMNYIDYRVKKKYPQSLEALLKAVGK
jgi:hypothetical protein